MGKHWSPGTEDRNHKIRYPKPTPEAFREIADALDAYDELRGITDRTTMQEDIRRWADDMEREG